MARKQIQSAEECADRITELTPLKRQKLITALKLLPQFRGATDAQIDEALKQFVVTNQIPH
jgi:hypothetical protein